MKGRTLYRLPLNKPLLCHAATGIQNGTRPRDVVETGIDSEGKRENDALGSGMGAISSDVVS